MIDFDCTAISEVRERLATQLGVDVSSEVAQKAIADPQYLYSLTAVKNNRAWLEALFRLALNEQPPEPNVEKSSLALGLSYLRSLTRSATNGFQSVPEQMLQRRWDACQCCPHLQDMPNRFLYHLGRGIIVRSNEDQRVCALCGCFAFAKAKKLHESCPAECPQDARMTRWQEPIAK